MYRVRNYLNQGATLKTAPKQEKLVLSLGGRKQMILRQNNGNLTQAGVHWERLTGRNLNLGGFKAQKPIRKGNTETIKLRNGERAITRRYDTVKQEWKFTKTGKAFYKTLARHYVVSLPVKLRGVRKDGTSYTQEGMHIPITKLGVNEPSIALDDNTPRRRAKIKQMVLDSLPERGGVL